MNVIDVVKFNHMHTPIFYINKIDRNVKILDITDFDRIWQENKKEDYSFLVYMHMNKINKKKYIGICRSSLRHRWGLNGSGYPEYNHKHFHDAIKKYGWNNFSHFVIMIHLTEEEAKQMESELIALYDTMNREKGYNKISFDNVSSYSVSEETKEKHRQYALTHGFITDGNITKRILKDDPIPEGWTRSFTEDHKSLIGVSLSGIPKSEEMRRRLVEVNTGKIHSEETKRKISEYQIGKIMITDGVKVSYVFDEKDIPNGWRKGVPPKSEITKERIRETLHKKWELKTDEEKEKVLTNQLNYRDSGKMWITDGKQNRFIRLEDNIPIGWRCGRCEETLQKIKESALNRDPSSYKNSLEAMHEWQVGSFWITNGVNELKIKEGSSIPEGWKMGRSFDTTYAKQRQSETSHGENNPSAKLNEEKVKEIKRSLRDTNDSYTIIAKRYGVDASLIGKIKKGLLWSYVSIDD